MGYNTTVVVLNDALDFIAADNHFGKKLKAAILKVGAFGGQADVTAINSTKGVFVNAATVIESHNANFNAVVAIGGNRGVELGFVDENKLLSNEELLRQLASNMGFDIHRKPTKKA